MGKIVLLVPREEMPYRAHNILQEEKYATSDMRMIQTKNAVVEARSAIAARATIIIARGLQASVIKQYTDIPVVEIMVAAREMVLLVVKAKQIVSKTKPITAVVGVESMFYDMTYFETIYDIKLRTYLISNGAGLEEQAKLAMEEGADLMTDGDVTVATAKEAGFPSLFLSMTEDSLRMAFAMAESMGFAMDTEKRSNAQIEVLLDYSFNSVVNMDRNGVITTVNPMMRDILEPGGKQTIGRRMEQIFQDVDQGKLVRVLEGRDESYSSFMQTNGTPVFAILAPIKVEDEVEGAILTCRKVKRQRPVKGRDHTDEDHLKHHGLIARGSFSFLVQNSRPMQDCIHLARLYSQSQQPVLVLRGAGSELHLMAGSIHNAGLYNDGAFLSLTCNDLSGEEQHNMIFGDKEAVFLAGGGTIYMEDVEHLSLSSQYGLYQLIRYKTGSSRDVAGTVHFHIRIIASSTLPYTRLWEMVEDGRFRRDLFCLLSGLKLQVPPLRERLEDLERLIENLLKEPCDRCSRYHVLAKGARQCLKEYGWPSNRIQLNFYMNCLVLTAGKRSVDKILVRAMLEKLYPPKEISPPGECKKEDRPVGLIKPVQSEGERQIRTALAKCSGNRERTAKGLKISKTTLWRKMKRYNIE